jgi:hypothetical protein
MPLVTRKYGPTAKGSKLSIQEMDENLLYLDDLIKNPTVVPSDYIDFNDVSVSPPAYSEGRIFYADGAFNAYIDESDITLQIGQEFWVKVRNSSGSDITDGQVVYISGAQGQAPTVELAQANSVITSFTLGIATHTIENNSFGYITIEGVVNNINTTGGAENWNDGDEVYLSATTLGALTNVKPTSPNADVIIGTVINATNNGSLLVSVIEPTAINDITEVNVTAPNDNDILQYNSSTNVWENTSSLTLNNVPAFDDDGAAAAGGLTAGDVYQTSGAGAAPLNAAGILMIKQ